MKLTPPFKILCTSKEMLEKVLLILLSHNNTWRSGNTTLKPGEQSFNFDPNIYVFIYLHKDNNFSYDELTSHVYNVRYFDTNNSPTYSDYPLMTLSELELWDKKF